MKEFGSIFGLLGLYVKKYLVIQLFVLYRIVQCTKNCEVRQAPIYNQFRVGKS